MSFRQRKMSASFGEEPSVYKVLVYNQLTPEEVSKANIDITKVSFWDVSASIPGNTAGDDPHISVYWYGPRVASEHGSVIYTKSHKLDPRFTDPIKSVIASKVGGTQTIKDHETAFKDFSMKINYASIADLARAIEQAGKLNCECTLEYEMISKEEKSSSALPKTKILGEKALEK